MRTIGAVTVSLALTLLVSHAQAQPLVCAPILPGDTTSSVAQRVTGDARNRHERWFQIVDPATSRFIEKSRYDHVRPGWAACVVREPPPLVGDRPLARAPLWTEMAFDPLTRSISDLISTPVPWVALVAILFALAWWGAAEYLDYRARTLASMHRFGETFIREFEKPLLQPDRPERPVRSRLRARAYRQQLDILLAPSGARRYPNLSDHRKNVEYDVTRVLGRMPDHRFVRGPLYTQDHWVVIPFQFQISTTQAGAK